MWETAEEFGALLVFAEHRYYGESMPYGPKSYDDKSRLGYLTSEQALADYVDLITYLRRNGSSWQLYEEAGDVFDDTLADDGGAGSSNPVIVFGGSYGGMLAAWFRIKYPAVVEGSVFQCDVHTRIYIVWCISTGATVELKIWGAEVTYVNV